MTVKNWKLRKVQLQNAGDWNGEMAVQAYLEGDENTYCRLIVQADRLWTKAASIKIV